MTFSHTSSSDDAVPDTFRIVVRRQGPAAVVTVVGEIDLTTAPQLHDTLTSTLDDAPGVVVADLTAVTFLDSSGLQAIIVAHLAAVANATRFAVVAATGVTLRPLQLTGLDEEIAVFGTLDAALTP